MKDKYVLCILGGHYGDEAKGKITDILAPKFDVVVRGSGGNNAGHTIIDGKRKIALHLLPAGVLHKGPLSVLGSEMMIDMEGLVAELEQIQSWNKRPKLLVSGKAHVVADWHKAFDGSGEHGKVKIGTTKRGIGPAAEAKYSRRYALQISDLLSPNLEDKIFQIVSEQKLRLIEQHPEFHKFAKMKIYDALYTKKSLALNKALKQYAKKEAEKLRKLAKIIEASVTNDPGLILANDKYKTILGEGAQGTMLDPTFGLLPFTTSTPTTVHGITRGMGLEPKQKESLGVFKAYETRVGEGPFPTEMETKLGREIQQKGGEFGATTGRARRCGWFNLEEAQYAVRVNGLTWIAITKMDVLDHLPEIKVGIETKNSVMKYKTFKGWMQDTTKCRNMNDLPAKAKEYVRWIEQRVAKIAFISVGPERTETIITDEFKNHLKINGVKW